MTFSTAQDLRIGEDSQGNPLWNGGRWGNAYDVSQYASISAAVTAIGSTRATLRYGADVSLADNLTIPATLEFQPYNGAIITVASGKTLTINGSVSAGAVQVFAGAGTVAGLKDVQLDWFGTNTIPGTTDMTSAFTKAATSLSAGGVVHMGPGPYVVSNASVGTLSNVKFIGNGTELRFLTYQGGSNWIVYFHDSDNVSFEGITFTSPSARPGATLTSAGILATDMPNGIYGFTSSNVTVDKCKFVGKFSFAVNAVQADDGAYGFTSLGYGSNNDREEEPAKILNKNWSITNNTFVVPGVGVELFPTINSKVLGNTFQSDPTVSWRLGGHHLLKGWFYDSIIANNKITETDDGVGTSGGIYARPFNTLITGNNITSHQVGVRLVYDRNPQTDIYFTAYPNNTTISANQIKSDAQGIFGEYLNDVRFIDNDITAGAQGIWLQKVIGIKILGGSINSSTSATSIKAQSRSSIEPSVAFELYGGSLTYYARDFVVERVNIKTPQYATNVIDIQNIHNVIVNGNTISGQGDIATTAPSFSTRAAFLSGNTGLIEFNRNQITNIHGIGAYILQQLESSTVTDAALLASRVVANGNVLSKVTSGGVQVLQYLSAHVVGNDIHNGYQLSSTTSVQDLQVYKYNLTNTPSYYIANNIIEGVGSQQLNGINRGVPLKGATANRPTPQSTDIGAVYLDTTLDPDGLPVVWQGTKWIKPDGTDA